MDDDTVLDYLEFRISSSSSSSSSSNSDNLNSSSITCELSISAGGESEKITSGNFKPFLAHIHAVHELLKKNPNSTSIKLEGDPHSLREGRRPWFTKKTVDRFVRFVSSPEILERVKTIEDELLQLEQVRNIQANNFVHMEDPLVGTGRLMNTDVKITVASGQNDYSPISDEVEASRKQLLKAMDIRLHALQREQKLAFSRAANAGFDCHTVEDLMMFAEFFRADRLCGASIWFSRLLRKQQQMNGNSMEAERQTFLQSNQPFLNGNGGKLESKGLMSLYGNLAQPALDELSTNSPLKLGKGLSQRTPPRRRSMSPVKKVQVGKFGSCRSLTSRSINSFSPRGQDVNNRNRNGNMESSSSDSEEYEKHQDERKRQPSTATRRLSVQAAISLFESKQEDPNATLKKQRSLRQETFGVSLDRSKAENNESRSCFVPKDKSEFIMNNQNRQLKSELKPFTAPIHVDPHGLMEFATLDCQANNQQEIVGLQDVRLLKKNYSTKESHGSDNLRSHESAESKMGCEGVGSVSWRTLSSDGLVCSNHRSSPRNVTSTDISSISLGMMQYTPCTTVPVVAQENTWLSEKNRVLAGQEQPDHFNDSGSININCNSNVTRESSMISCSMYAEHNMKALVNMMCHPNQNEELSERCEGRFYEHYTKLRNAKMMDEQSSKRAEREAKLRSMEETLDLREAEMHANAVKLSKEGKRPRIRAIKLLDLRENPCNAHNSQISHEERSKQSHVIFPPSPPLTPQTAKESPKLQKTRKATSASQKTAITHRNSMHALSISPKSASTGAVCKASGSQSSVSCSMGDNQLECFSELKKENSESTCSNSSRSSLMYLKSDRTSEGLSKRSAVETTGAPNSSSNKTARKNKTAHTKMALEDNGKMSPSSNRQEGIKSETPLSSKIRRSAVAPIHEVKAIPQESGIGHGAYANVSKVRGLSNADAAAKSSDDYSLWTPLHGSEYTREKDENNHGIHEGQKSQKDASLFIQETGEKEMETDLDISSDTQVITDYPDCMHQDESLVHASSAKYKESLKKEMTYHTSLFPIDCGKHELHCSALEADSGCNCVKDTTINEEVDGCGTETLIEEKPDSALGEFDRGQINTLSKLIAESVLSSQREKLGTGSTSFHANLVRDEHTILNQSSVVDMSQERCMIMNAEYGLLESAIPSPASWDSSYRQYSPVIDTVCTHKKWASSSQKPVVVVVPPKEPAKGLKRLLKFARKNRGTSEVIIADCLAPEGDHDSEGTKVKVHSVNDLMKLGVNGRMLKEFSRQNGVCNASGSNKEKGSVQSQLRSSIPTPPSNFNLKDDHVPWSSTRLKASRSFFSLPNFRNRGSEGKSG